MILNLLQNRDFEGVLERRGLTGDGTPDVDIGGLRTMLLFADAFLRGLNGDICDG
jgi:hypothetical protein